MFKNTEIKQIEEYLKKINEDQTQEFLYGIHKANPDWQEVYPLFQRLIDYGIGVVDKEMNDNYVILKNNSDNIDILFKYMHAYYGSVERLILTYKLHHNEKD